MGLLKSGRMSKKDLHGIWQSLDRAEAEALSSVKPAIYEVLTKIVGTQYYSLATLRNMGHPYKSRPPGGLHPGVINVQSGAFFGSFKLVGPSKAGTTMALYLVNTSPKAALLNEGTDRMIPRPWSSYLMWHLQRAIRPKLGLEVSKRIKLRQLR